MSEFIEIYDANNIAELVWPNDEDHQNYRVYLEELVQANIKDYVANANTILKLLKIDDVILPISICDYSKSNTFVCSIHTQYISYAIAELSKLESNPLKIIAGLLLKPLSWLVKLGKLDKAVHINNWLFPTNIHPEMNAQQVHRMIEFLTLKFPNHGLIFRTLNQITDKPLLEELVAAKFKLLGSRQIYLLSKSLISSFKSKAPRDIRRDEKLISINNLNISDSPDNYPSIQRELNKLYSSLYVEKHSHLNPMYTTKFFDLILRVPGFSVQLVLDEAKLIGFIAYLTRYNVTYAPMLGYDVNLPQSKGIYRVLSSLKITAAQKAGSCLHSSAGAASFKRNRGHTAIIEYHAIYSRHLSLARRSIYYIMMIIVNKFAMPVIQRYEL